MDSFTVNKIAGAVLGTCVVGMGIGILAQGYFEPSAPKKPGYALPNPKPETATAEKAAPETPLPVLLAKADVKKGEADAKVCTACHNLEEGAGAKVGPPLWGVVDRPKGSVPGYDYSEAMKKKGGKWTFADLNQFLTKPSAYVPGTKMGFAGEDSPEKRADIIAYLRTLSKNPAPLPPVTEADKTAAAGTGGAKPSEGGGASADNTAAAGGDAALIKMIADSDPKKGQADAQVCSACHNFKKGAGALVGPDLWGVVDRPKGSEPGYDYSEAMKHKGGKWTFADLNQFLTKPQAYVKGTKMGFTGEDDPKKRAQIIAFLRTLSDNPVPLPGAPAKPDEKAADTGSADTAKVIPSAKPPGDETPPPPPNKPGAAPGPAEAPSAPPPPPAKAEAPPAPPAPPAKAEASPAPPAPPAKAEAPPAPPPPPPPAKTEAPSSKTPGEGPEPYTAPDPTVAPQTEAPSLKKQTSAPPSLTPGGETKAGEAGSAAGPEPYSAPDPADASSHAASAGISDKAAGSQPAAGGEAAAGPEPYSAPDPTVTSVPGERTLQKETSAPPSLTPGGSGDESAGGTAAGPEPYSAPDPNDSSGSK